MADHGGNGGNGEIVDRPEDWGETMAVEQEDQQSAEAVVDTGAVVEGGGDGGEGREQEVGDGANRRATEAEPRATKEAGAVGSSVEPAGLGTVAECSPTVGGSLADVGGSATVGDDPGPNVSPPRDPAKGKGVVAEEEETREVPVEYREEDVAFWPVATAATSLSHIPITKYGVAEHLPDEMLAKLLEDNPLIGEMVLRAKEERARAIAASEAAARVEREQKEGKDLLREAETEERAGAKEQ
ncbi:hypothetical protein RHMOL_Rhmol01G0211700 [Rhododendron molle]|uniref:Uncharacterized protein n=1 Tax=Rhododendron molle TaxID=49168 RepID=A0ACC0Q5E5_RHOML|nr:hypothetical protein RHMOL_Rhmol01G0211700 [Rhododendron molle]